MKSTAEEIERRKKCLAATLIRYVLYLFSPEEGTEQQQIRKAEQPLQWMRRHEGKTRQSFGTSSQCSCQWELQISIEIVKIIYDCCKGA